MPDRPAPTTTTSTWAGRGRCWCSWLQSCSRWRASFLILARQPVLILRDNSFDTGRHVRDPLRRACAASAPGGHRARRRPRRPCARRARLDAAALDADDLLVPDVAVAGGAGAGRRRARLPRPRPAGRRAAGPVAARPAGAGHRELPHRRRRAGVHLALPVRARPRHADLLRARPRRRARGRGAALRRDAAGRRAAARRAPTCRLGTLHRNIRSLVGGSYGLRTVDLPYPPLAPRAAYEDFFGARVRFERAAAAAAAAQQPRARCRSPGATRRCAASPWSSSTGSRPRATSRLADAGARRRAAAARHRAPPRSARSPGCSTCTPARCSAAWPTEGTTFAAIVDDVRREAARRYLTTTDLPLAQVAGLLGFAEQAVLTAGLPALVRRHAARGATPG